MDFWGTTPEDATLALIERARELSGPAQDAFATQQRGVFSDSYRLAARDFELNVRFHVEKRNAFRQRLGWSNCAGKGELRLVDGAVLLCLLEDADGEYRWHRTAAHLAFGGKLLMKPREGHWFPATDTWLEELLARETHRQAPRAKLLVMK